MKDDSREKRKKLMVIDGYGLIYRSYFVFLNRPLKDPQGNNISAVYGFFRSLLSLMRNYQPEGILVALDSIQPTFRHEAFKEYKATRDKSPDDLKSQIPVVERILDEMHIPTLRREGFEADDIIATVARKCGEDKGDCLIVSNDKDLLQLVDGRIKTLRYEQGKYKTYGSSEVEEHLGIKPEQIVDYLSLLGDSADNIPGVKGIGKKGAVKLLQQYGSLDNIFEHLEDLTKGNRKKLEEGKESAYLSKELIVLKQISTVHLDWENWDVKTVEPENALNSFAEIGAKSLIKEVGGDPDAVSITKLQMDEAGNDSESPESIVEAQGLRGEGRYEIADSLKQVDKILAEVKKSGTAACDIETDNLNVMQANIAGISFSISPRKAWYIPLYAGGNKILPEEEVKQRVKKVLEDPAVRIIGQNFSYDYKVLKRWGVEPANLYFDTMIAAWLLDATSNTFSMDALAEHYLDYKTIKYKDTVEKGQLFPDVEIGKAGKYAAEDADITYRLYVIFARLIKDRGLEEVFYSLEMPLAILLARMELRGIRLQKDELDQYKRELDTDLNEIEHRIYALCGREFNINSTKQLQEVLFKERGLKPIKKTKTGYSTDTSVLELLASEDEVPDMILRHRTLSKLRNTYVAALPELIDKHTGRIHTSFTQTGTATGRLSSRNPNLQNIPIRTEEGRRIRKAFVPSAGCEFISADYSQIELVILAHLADDPGLKEAFLSGEDVHRHTGSLIFQLAPEDVTSEQRRIAKTINFGVMYGMSAFRLSRELGIPRKQAEAFIESYFSRYTGIRKFIDSTVQEAENTGRVRTLLGHERIIPGISSSSKTEKAGAERIAVNTPIQGTAADIMKLAMLKVDKKLTEKGFRAAILLQIHDELLLEVPHEEIDEVKALVKNEMEQIVSLSVPLRVSVEVGKSWGDLH
ncbi:MAG: DNA polymerase I [Spirochaetia bacterium]|nr:DNA polymerase I [Spirochaetia bacterium]